MLFDSIHPHANLDLEDRQSRCPCLYGSGGIRTQRQYQQFLDDMHITREEDIDNELAYFAARRIP